MELSRRRVLHGLGLSALGVAATTHGSRTAIAVSNWNDTNLTHTSSTGTLPSLRLNASDITFQFVWSNFPTDGGNITITLDARLPSTNTDYEQLFTGTLPVQSETGDESFDGTQITDVSFPVSVTDAPSITTDDFAVPDGASESTTAVDFRLTFDFEDTVVVRDSTCTVTVQETTTVIDDFETGDLSAYSGDTGNFEVQSDITYEGNYALRCTTTTTSGSNILYSLSGLNSYPEAGDTIRLWTRTDAENGSLARPFFHFGVQSDVSNHYTCRLRYPYNGDPAELNTNFVGNNTLDHSYVLGEWYLIEIEWGTDGAFTVTIYDSNENVIDGPITGNDTRWTTGGIGFNSAGGADEVYDFVTK